MTAGAIARQIARLAYARLVPFSYRVAFRQAYFSREASTAYREVNALLQTAVSWDAGKWAEFQVARLRSLLEWAVKTVPFWQTWQRDSHWSPADLRVIADLQYLPTMSKADLQEKLHTYTSQAIPSTKRIYATTGGSTATPIGFFEEVATPVAREHAYLDHVRGQLACTEHDAHAIVGGAFVGDPDRGRLWDYNPIWNELAVSSYHLDEDHLPLIWNRLIDFGPSYIEGYSSALTQLAEYAAMGGQPIRNLKAVFARSENLYPYQRERISRALHVPVLNWYGHAEKAVLAAECPAHMGYHVFPSYGVVELLDRAGSPITTPGQVGEIVSTGFLNLATVFVRYRTADFASWMDERPCNCKSPTPRLSRIDGRLQEFVIGTAGRLISTAAINFHNAIFDRVRQFQFYQDTPGAVILRVVPRGAFGQADLLTIHQGVMRKLGSEMHLELQVVDRIPPAPSGKQRVVMQKLAVPAWSMERSGWSNV